MPMTRQQLEKAFDAADKAPEVRVDVLSMRKRTTTTRGVRFHSYDVELRVREGRRDRFLSLQADADGTPELPAGESGAVRRMILDAVRARRR